MTSCRAKWLQASLAVALVLSVPSLSRGQTAGTLDLGSFLDKAAQKIKSYPDNVDWTANVIAKTTKMDRNWTPESMIVVSKAVKVLGGEREEVILKAEETKKGKTKDLTQKYAEDAQEARDKAKKRHAEERGGRGGAGRGGASISLDSVLPFSSEKRGQFDFLLTENALVDGRPAFLLEVKAKVKDEKNWEGRFYFDPATIDLLGIEVKPSENPSMVKDLEFRMTFEILDGRYLAVKSTWIKVNGGFFLKHVRQIVEETYSGFEVLK